MGVTKTIITPGHGPKPKQARTIPVIYVFHLT